MTVLDPDSGSGSLVDVPDRTWLVDPTARLLAVADGVLVRRADMVTRLEGEGVDDFVAAILSASRDGRLRLPGGQIDKQRSERLDSLLAALESSGLLQPDDDDTATADSPIVFGLWSRSGYSVDRGVITERLARARVRILGHGAMTSHVVTAMQGAGIAVDVLSSSDQVSPPAQIVDEVDDTAGNVTVVVGRSDSDRLLSDWNRTVCDNGDANPWLAVTPFDGRRATVGPWVTPGSSACYRCYQLRRAATFPDESVVTELADGESTAELEFAPDLHPGVTLMQAGLVVDRVLDYLGLREQSWQAVPGGLTTVSVDPSGATQSTHRVLRVPRCPICSPAAGRGYPQVWFGRPLGDGSPTADVP